MGLGVKVLVRHPQGEEDLLCPTVWCDVCGGELTGTLQDGCRDVYAFTSPDPKDDGSKGFCEGREPVPLRTMHGGRCFDLFRESAGFNDAHMTMEYLIVNMAANLGLVKGEED